MKKRMTCLLLSCAVVVTAFLYQEKVSASTAFGFSATTLAKGTLESFDVLNETQVPTPDPNDGDAKTLWFSLQKVIGRSDVYVQSNTWQPGGTTGWHSHPGHSVIIVTDGTITDYESHESGCERNVYTKGMSFVDSGGDHVHLIRNETAYPASTVAVQTIPVGATRRVDKPIQTNCPGVQ
jgi:quercetin dioxygenase-like cupin family protein